MIDRRWEILFSFFVFQIHSMNDERNRNKTNNDETQFNNLSSDLVFFFRFSFLFSYISMFFVIVVMNFFFFFCWFFFSLCYGSPISMCNDLIKCPVHFGTFIWSSLLMNERWNKDEIISFRKKKPKYSVNVNVRGCCVSVSIAIF